MIIAKTNLGMCSAHLVMTSAKFPEACQEMSEACVLEETLILAEWEDETSFYVWEILGPRWYSRCDSIFSWSSFLPCRVVRLARKSTHSTLKGSIRRFPTWAFTENCALKVVLDGEFFEDFLGDF